MPEQTHGRRARAFIPRGVAALLVALTLTACAAGETPRSEPGANAPTSQPGEPTTQPGEPTSAPVAPEGTSEPTETKAPRTPGPSVPRVPPLQPPAYASRVVVPALGIDLPVISGDLQPPPSYPYCDVAAYVTRFNQPYETGITYISAHAQRGMFLPLLQASERNDGQELLGQTVDVYVSDGRLFTYRIERVVRHATDYAVVAEIPPTEQHLILQTSEGPYGTIEKLQVIAQLESETVVPDVAVANPEAQPRDCEPDGTPAPASPAS
jgi:hypothetical protein